MFVHRMRRLILVKQPRTLRRAIFLVVFFVAIRSFDFGGNGRTKMWSSHDDSNYSDVRRKLTHEPPPDQRDRQRCLERRNIRKMKKMISSSSGGEGQQRALLRKDLSKSRPRKMNKQERYSLRVLNRRERNKLQESKEDIWLRLGVRDGESEEFMDEDEVAEALDDETVRHLLGGEEYKPLVVCDRLADIGTVEDLKALQKYAACQEVSPDRPILVLNGLDSYGRLGNNLVELLHAMQYARDNDIQLGISVHSWAMAAIQNMWLSAKSDNWESELEQALCVKIFHDTQELQPWDDKNNTKFIETKELFLYSKKDIPLKEYMMGQEHVMRTLYRHYNDGEGGVNHLGQPVRNMCSGLDALFGSKRKHAIYSVIHARSLEGEPGKKIMASVARRSGCDPEAALYMKPGYIKSILKPLGMLRYPIVVISDGQDPLVVQRLKDDKEIGKMIYVTPPEASWYGADMTTATMANVFIGNPASTFSSFIAKSRLALGFGHNYLYRAKNEEGEWITVCGASCLFDSDVAGPMA